MVDYVQLISRAVATLNPNTREARQALYQRARQTLVDKLSSIDPTLSHTDLKAERAALESAILQVEGDAVRRAAPPQRQPAQDRTQDRVQVRSQERYDYRDRPPLKDPRNWLRTATVALGVLLVFAVGAGIYSFWPRSLDDVRSMAKQRSVSSTSEPAEIKSDFVRLRQLVYYRTTQPVGTIVVDKSQTFLYVVRPNLSALRYSIGVGTECTALSGLYHVARKEELPGRKPSGQQPPDSPVLYLDKADYRIHGFDGSAKISLPEGCIRLIKDDVVYLYNHTPLETRVVVAN
ncbi:MAG TPA: L,D-transpeptidase family protein [Pseudolabrys sp.]|nr:L,D-transpeptidase family protein [Pseudolabrys sp.]